MEAIGAELIDTFPSSRKQKVIDVVDNQNGPSDADYTADVEGSDEESVDDSRHRRMRIN
jgi:hypothetical protein